LADVFISYSRADQASARRVAKTLQGQGIEVWWDADLPAHRAYSESIERNLADAKAVLVLWSKSAAASQWVRAEADFARNAGKLVQARLDDSMPPMPFNQIACADLKGWRGASAHSGWAKVVASVGSLISGEERSAPSLAPLGFRERLIEKRWWVAAALTLVLAAGAWLLLFGMPGEHRKPVIAVLPFKSLDSHDESLVAGMWEDTRSAIGRNPQLIVLGPNTAEQLAEKGDRASAKAADYLLHASVRTAGDKVRVSADLVRTSDGQQIWSQDFDRKLDDVFQLQTDIANDIEGPIRGRLAESGGVTPEHIATTGDVYALYSDARAKVRKRNADDAVAAHAELEQVLKQDPNYAPAWAAMAAVMWQIPPSRRNWTTGGSAEAYARRAVELAPNLAAGHAALALSLGLRGPVAKAEVERAVELDPSDFEAVTWLGNIRSSLGDKKGAIEAYRQAAAMEPLFWPAALNLYSSLKAIGDTDGIRQLLEQLKRVGADYLVRQIQIDDAFRNGNLADAANIGLRYWNSGEPKANIPAMGDSWTVLLQLGLFDEAAKFGNPDFAPYLWKLDPRGLDILESHKIPPHEFFSLMPLTENAGRLYVLSGRSKKLSDMYSSLKMSPEQFRHLAMNGGAEHFILSAPLIAIALRENGHARDADLLLQLAEADAKQVLRDGTPVAAAELARVYAVEGRKEEAVSLLAAAVGRGWIPAPPEILPDLHSDPALASLKGDRRFEKARDQLLALIARERAKVDPRLLAQLKAA
jgi:adenylate cyclase